MKQDEMYLPYMNTVEILYLLQFLNRDQSILEIGGGKSTIFFSRLVKKVTTLEHNEEWFYRIKEMVTEVKNNHSCEFHLVLPNYLHQGLNPAEPGQFDNYVDFLSTLEKKSFDLVLVDGRDRVRCFEKSIPLVKPGGLIIIHDFWNRERYKEILDFTEVELLHSENSYVYPSENTLAVFTKK
jgi:predicted O-methyltransferase YrrM